MLTKGKILGVCALLLSVLVIGCGGGSEEDKLASEIDAYKKELEAATSKGDLKTAMQVALEKGPKLAEKINKSALSPEKKKALLERLEKK